MLFVDLDRFKHVNDALGHHVGDALLQSVSKRLLQLVREGDTVSRLGGDEFVVILNGIGDAEAIAALLDTRLIPAMRQPHQVEGSALSVSCSVGVAIYPDHGDDMDTLMRHADAAMYQAKSGGRDHARMFTPQMQEQQLQQLHLESDLRHAIERQELVLYYQPRIDAQSSRLNGVESLIRWQHPQHGLIAPDSFIPAAEESGLIVSIGAWVIREACRQQLAWCEAGAGDIAVSINLSAIQLKSGTLVATLREVLREFPVTPGQIEFELTESILMDNVDDTHRHPARHQGAGVCAVDRRFRHRLFKPELPVPLPARQTENRHELRARHPRFAAKPGRDENHHRPGSYAGLDGHRRRRGKRGRCRRAAPRRLR